MRPEEVQQINANKGDSDDFKPDTRRADERFGRDGGFDSSVSFPGHVRHTAFPDNQTTLEEAFGEEIEVSTGLPYSCRIVSGATVGAAWLAKKQGCDGDGPGADAIRSGAHLAASNDGLELQVQSQASGPCRDQELLPDGGTEAKEWDGSGNAYQEQEGGYGSGPARFEVHSTSRSGAAQATGEDVVRDERDHHGRKRRSHIRLKAVQSQAYETPPLRDLPRVPHNGTGWIGGRSSSLRTSQECFGESCPVREICESCDGGPETTTNEEAADESKRFRDRRDCGGGAAYEDNLASVPGTVGRLRSNLGGMADAGEGRRRGSCGDMGTFVCRPAHGSTPALEGEHERGRRSSSNVSSSWLPRACPRCPAQPLSYEEFECPFRLKCDGVDHVGDRALDSQPRFSCTKCAAIDLCVPCTRELEPSACAKQVTIRLRADDEARASDDETLGTGYLLRVRGEKKIVHDTMKRIRDRSHRDCVAREKFEKIKDELLAAQQRLQAASRAKLGAAADSGGTTAAVQTQDEASVRCLFAEADAEYHLKRAEWRSNYNHRKATEHKELIGSLRAEREEQGSTLRELKTAVKELRFQLRAAQRERDEAVHSLCRAKRRAEAFDELVTERERKKKLCTSTEREGRSREAALVEGLATAEGEMEAAKAAQRAAEKATRVAEKASRATEAKLTRLMKRSTNDVDSLCDRLVAQAVSFEVEKVDDGVAANVQQMALTAEMYDLERIIHGGRGHGLGLAHIAGKGRALAMELNLGGVTLPSSHSSGDGSTRQSRHRTVLFLSAALAGRAPAEIAQALKRNGQLEPLLGTAELQQLVKATVSDVLNVIQRHWSVCLWSGAP